MPTLGLGYVCDRHACVFSRDATRMASGMLASTPVTQCDIWLQMVQSRNAKNSTPSDPKIAMLGIAINLSSTFRVHSNLQRESLGLDVVAYTLHIHI